MQRHNFQFEELGIPEAIVKVLIGQDTRAVGRQGFGKLFDHVDVGSRRFGNPLVKGFLG